MNRWARRSRSTYRVNAAGTPSDRAKPQSVPAPIKTSRRRRGYAGCASSRRSAGSGRPSRPPSSKLQTLDEAARDERSEPDEHRIERHEQHPALVRQLAVDRAGRSPADDRSCRQEQRSAAEGSDGRCSPADDDAQRDGEKLFHPRDPRSRRTASRASAVQHQRTSATISRNTPSVGVSERRDSTPLARWGQAVSDHVTKRLHLRA
jgi:hypothetical protein